MSHHYSRVARVRAAAFGFRAMYCVAVLRHWVNVARYWGAVQRVRLAHVRLVALPTVRKAVGLAIFALLTIIAEPIALVVRVLDGLALLALPREYQRFLRKD